MGCKSSKQSNRVQRRSLILDISKPINVVFTGDSGVGKSSLIYRYTTGTFKEEEVPLKTPVGQDFILKKTTIKGVEVELHIWDTGGQERYNTLTQSYYRIADCVICVYDINSQSSFENMPQWWKEVIRYSQKSACKIVVGNKADLAKVVEPQNFLEEIGNPPHYETSAKTGQNVEELFTKWFELY